jgi:transcriptional regulator with XRE-family HTH domain
MSTMKEVESEAFRKWFSSQRTYSSLSAMERSLNITKDYLHQIRDGSRRAVDPELRRKIQETTGLKEFGRITDVSTPSISLTPSKRGIQQATRVSKVPIDERLPENLSTLLKSAIKKLGLTLHECSEIYKIRPGALKKYKSGVRRPASEKNIIAVLKILNDAELVTSEVTPSTNFKAEEQPFDIRALIREVKELREKVDQIDTKLGEARIYQEMTKKPTSDNAEERARTVMRLLMSLSKELEFFKSCSENERRIFKKTVPGQDVGYITTLLRALYDEDKFQRWLLFSTYTMKGKENGE